MTRLVVWLLSALLTLLLVVVGLLGLLTLTTAGARWLAEQAMELEPRLRLTVEGGAIVGGLAVSGLRWEDRDIAVEAARAELAWSPGCLLAARICLDRVVVDGLTVTVRPQAEAQPEPESALPGRLELPVGMRLQLLQLDNVRVELPDAALALRSLQGSAELSGGALTVEWLLAAGLDVAIDVGAERSAAKPAAPPAAQLPTIVLPLDLVAKSLLLEDARLRMPAGDYRLRQLAVAGSLRGSLLALDRLALHGEPLTATLTGQVELADAYPLALRLAAELTPPELPRPLRLAATAAGDMRQLALELEASGLLELQLKGSVQPLAPRLPFDFTARWQELRYPFDDEPLLLLRDGVLAAAGDLGDYRGSLAVAVAGPQVPAGHWRLRFAGDSGELRDLDAEAATLGGSLRIAGRLSWRDGLRWQAAAKAQGLNPASHWPALPGALGGELQAAGAVAAGDWSLAVDALRLDGELLGHPLRLQGRLDKPLAAGWRFQNVRLESGRNRVRVDGRLGQQWALQGAFDLPQPQGLLPGLQGSLRGQLALTGAMLEPDLRLQLQGRGLRYREHAAESLTLQLDLRRLALEDSSLQLAASGLTSGALRLARLQGALVGSRSAHALSLQAEGDGHGGRLELEGELTAELDWRGRLRSAALFLPQQQWRLEQPVALGWQHRARRLDVAAHCWRQQAARLCLTRAATVGAEGSVALALNGFRLEWLASLLPEGLVWQAPLDGEAELHWLPAQRPAARVVLESRGGAVVLEREDDDPLRLAYQSLAVRLGLAEEALALELELASEQLGAGRLQARTELAGDRRPLRGDIDLDGLQLGLLQAFLPDIQTLSGTIGIRGQLGGSLAMPQFHGTVALANGELVATGLPMALSAIELRAEVAGDAARLRGGFRSGEGTARIDGQATWSRQSWRLALALSGARLEAAYEQMARLYVSPNLALTIEPGRVGVTGQVVVPEGTIAIKRLPEGAVAVSDDVVVINRPGQAEVEAPPAADWDVLLDIELLLGEAVRIEGFGLEGRLAGSLRLRQRAQGVPEAAGEISVVEGRYEAYGQKLEIRQGLLLFSGPLTQPSMLVEAVRRVDNVVAGLRVEGEPEQPQVTLFSEPGLPQEEILSYLIRGRPLGGGGGGSDQLLAQAAISLGIFGGRGFATSLASELGVEDFEVGTSGEGEETQVELSGYITPDLLVRYGIGVFEPVNTLTLRYRVNRNFYVEAVSGLESALDFFYEFEF